MARGHSPPRTWRGDYHDDVYRRSRPRSRSRSPGAIRGARDRSPAGWPSREPAWPGSRGYDTDPRLPSRDYRAPSPARRARSRSPVPMRDPFPRGSGGARSPPRRVAPAARRFVDTAPPYVVTSSLHEDIKSALDRAYANGDLRPGHVLQSNVQNLMEMPVKLALEAVAEYAHIDKTRVKHPGAFFTGVIKRILEQNGYPAPTPYDPRASAPSQRERSPPRRALERSPPRRERVDTYLPPPPSSAADARYAPPSASSDRRGGAGSLDASLSLRAGPPRFDPYTGEPLNPTEAARRFPSASRASEPYGRDRGSHDAHHARNESPRPASRAVAGGYSDDRWARSSVEVSRSTRDDPRGYRDHSPQRRNAARDMDLLPPPRRAAASPPPGFFRDPPPPPLHPDRAPYGPDFRGSDVPPPRAAAAPRAGGLKSVAIAAPGAGTSNGDGGDRVSDRNGDVRGDGDRRARLSSDDRDFISVDPVRYQDEEVSHGGHHSAADEEHINETWPGHEAEGDAFDASDLVDHKQVQQAMET